MYTESVCFPSFEKSLTFLIQGTNFNLKNIFKDLCGKDRKYINFARFYRAYLAYRSNTNELSSETKNFLGYVFKELLHVFYLRLLFFSNLMTILVKFSQEQRIIQLNFRKTEKLLRILKYSVTQTMIFSVSHLLMTKEVTIHLCLLVLK